jgi:hypothetical protein
MAYYDPASWFERTESKCRCGKRATGILRGVRNESFGPYCEPCANKRIKAAQRERQIAPPHPAAVALSKMND